MVPSMKIFGTLRQKVSMKSRDSIENSYIQNFLIAETFRSTKLGPLTNFFWRQKVFDIFLWYPPLWFTKILAPDNWAAPETLATTTNTKRAPLQRDWFCETKSSWDSNSFVRKTTDCTSSIKVSEDNFICVWGYLMNIFRSIFLAFVVS